jgi:hypothetical protein
MIASEVYVETVSEVYVGTASEVYVGAVALGCPPGEARLLDSFTKPCHPERSCRPQSGRQRSRRIPTIVPIQGFPTTRHHNGSMATVTDFPS